MSGEISTKSTEEKLDLSLNYLLLRKLIGTVGILLPLGCFIWEGTQLDSISHYYYSDATVLFTGTLIILGAFLVCNKGYQNTGEWISDWTVNIVAGLAIMAVAFIPTDYQSQLHQMPIFNKEDSTGQMIHFSCAVLFFLLMGLTFIFKFTLTRRGTDGKRIPPSDRKKKEIFWYQLMGGLILGTLGIAGIIILLNEISVMDWMPDTFIFWVEILLLIPFAIAWFIKGKAHKDIESGAKLVVKALSGRSPIKKKQSPKKDDNN